MPRTGRQANRLEAAPRIDLSGAKSIGIGKATVIAAARRAFVPGG
jgi:hypothetical protein